LAGLLCDKGFNGKAFAAELAERGIAVLIPPTKAERKTMPKMLQKVIVQWRNRVETSLGEITDFMELARHGAHTFWGLLTRTAATLPRTRYCVSACRPHRPQSTHITRLRSRGCRCRSGRLF
jgi:hypothetical protein